MSIIIVFLSNVPGRLFPGSNVFISFKIILGYNRALNMRIKAELFLVEKYEKN